MESVPGLPRADSGSGEFFFSTITHRGCPG